MVACSRAAWTTCSTAAPPGARVAAIEPVCRWAPAGTVTCCRVERPLQVELVGGDPGRSRWAAAVGVRTASVLPGAQWTPSPAIRSAIRRPRVVGADVGGQRRAVAEPGQPDRHIRRAAADVLHRRPRAGDDDVDEGFADDGDRALHGHTLGLERDAGELGRHLPQPGADAGNESCRRQFRRSGRPGGAPTAGRAVVGGRARVGGSEQDGLGAVGRPTAGRRSVRRRVRPAAGGGGSTIRVCDHPGCAATACTPAPATVLRRRSSPAKTTWASLESA